MGKLEESSSPMPSNKQVSAKYPLVTISVPTAPEPEYAKRYRSMNGGKVTVVVEKPVLRVEVYESKDGYGIVGEDMIPGRSITIRADKEYHARVTYLGKGKYPDPILIYTHPQNPGKVHVAWELKDGTERGGDLSGGKTINLQDIWAEAWIIEASQGNPSPSGRG